MATVLTEYEWTFIRIASLLFLFIAGFLRTVYAGHNLDTLHILTSTVLFGIWLTLSKVITNYIEQEKVVSESISLTHILFYYVAIPLIMVSIIMLTGFFRY